MTRLQLRLLVAYLTSIGSISACSSESSTSDRISVGGTYRTAISLTSSTCPGQTVEQHETIVTHSPGATSLSLSHAGSTYQGVLQQGGAFSTPPVVQTVDGIAYTIALTGQFTTTALDASVHVTAAKQPPCEFIARWAGPKSGPPNVIP